MSILSSFNSFVNVNFVYASKQLAKRSVQVTSEPRYLLRLDLANSAVGPAETAAGAEKYRSHHLQADHASMKLLEQELQRAVDELSSVHCQRINRYMS